MILRKKDREMIVKIAERTISKPFHIWAYGSRVNGKAHETSDLDLVIKKDEKLPINELTEFKENLKLSNIPIIVQTVDWNRIPESFQKNIMNSYEVLTEER
jgi:predicted nucleotidyltransferase